MPGIVKVGRTERQPEVRSQELRTTGVPSPFTLEHCVFVRDVVSAEQQAHALLESRGLRTSADREFFNITVQEAIEAVDWIKRSDTSSKPDFQYMGELAAMASTIHTPTGDKRIDGDEADRIVQRIAQIARRGYPLGLKRCAEVFDYNCPTSLPFKNYWREYLELARAEAVRYNVASGGEVARQSVGKEATEYFFRCHTRGWLDKNDFQFISEFLVAGDQFQYQGYLSQIRRFRLPASVLEIAESL